MDYQDLKDFDPLDIAEKSGLNPFLLLRVKVDASENFAKALKDSYFSMPWKELLSLVETNPLFPFTIKFNHTRDVEGIKEQEVIWWDDEHHLLLCAESYGERVNNCHCYGNCPVQEGKSDHVWQFLKNCSHGATVNHNGEPIDCCDWSYDGREFLFSKILEIVTGIGTCPWQVSPFLWLLNYSEKSSENYREINYAKLQPWFPYLDLYKEKVTI